MGSDMMDLTQLAAYLHRDAREVSKLVSRGHVPGHKVAGEWRFAQAEINQWLEGQLAGYTDQQLTALETHGNREVEQEALVTQLLSPTNMAVPLAARTRASALKELVRLAEQTWNVFDPDAILQAVTQREDLASTALPTGVAIPHLRRPLPKALGDPVMAYGRTASGIPYGEPSGTLTDIFFLVLSRDDRMHLQVLARLSRLLLRPGFLDALRAAETVEETWDLLAAAERDLVTE
jgi:PTS system nitrogen regulatory IIA component